MEVSQFIGRRALQPQNGRQAPHHNPGGHGCKSRSGCDVGSMANRMIPTNLLRMPTPQGFDLAMHVADTKHASHDRLLQKHDFGLQPWLRIAFRPMSPAG